MVDRLPLKFAPALRPLLLAMLCATLALRAFAAEAPLIAVPNDHELELRVLYLEDPRLPSLDAGQRRTLCDKIERLLPEWLGYRARLREVGQRNLAEYFTARAADFRRHHEILRLNLDPEREADRARIHARIKARITPRRLADLHRLLPPGKWESHEQAVTAAYGHLLGQLREIRAIPLPDGGTFFDEWRPELNSYMHWCALTHEMTEADLVFTNSLIVGADMEMELTVIGRGGVTAGNANANRHNAFGSAAMAGMFHLLSDAPFWLRKRGPIPDDERLDAIATIALHELGHMLLRNAHPTAHPPGCLFAPSADLRYYDWHVAIRKHGPCRLPHPKLTSY